MYLNYLFYLFLFLKKCKTVRKKKKDREIKYLEHFTLHYAS